MNRYIVCRRPSLSRGDKDAGIIHVVVTKDEIVRAVEKALNCETTKRYKAELAFVILLKTHEALNFREACAYCRKLNNEFINNKKV